MSGHGQDLPHRVVITYLRTESSFQWIFSFSQTWLTPLCNLKLSSYLSCVACSAIFFFFALVGSTVARFIHLATRNFGFVSRIDKGFLFG